MSQWWICFLQIRSFSLHKATPCSQSSVDYCDFFQLYELIVTAPIPCREAIYAMLIFYNPMILLRNKLIYILDSLRVSKLSASIHFWKNYPC